MKRNVKKTKQSTRQKIDKQALIKRVLRGAVTPEQHREKIPEWQRITPELQERLIRLSDEYCAKMFLRKYKSKLTKPAAPQARYADIWQRLHTHDFICPEKRFCRSFSASRLRSPLKSNVGLCAGEKRPYGGRQQGCDRENERNQQHESF